MPTYVYACKECDDRLEVVQKMSDDPLKDCPKCGGSLRRVLFPPAVVYKGSGFYVTDYKQGGRGSGSSSDSAPESSAASNASKETKTEAKSDSGSDSKPAPAVNTTT